jgi:predicted acyl esterase
MRARPGPGVEGRCGSGHRQLLLSGTWPARQYDTNDADLFMALKKLDAGGKEVPFVFSQMFDDGPAAVGWLRVSHRGLEETVSRPERPWHTHARRELLTGQDPVPVDVEIWPTSISFAAGESLRLVVQGSDVYKSPGPFGVTHWPLHNFGRHVIHAGGRYDSHLLVPVVPPGGETGVTRAGALPLPGPGRGHHPGTF